MNNSIGRYRIALFFATLLCVALGIATRTYPCGLRLWDKYLGDALYVACFYLALGIAVPWRPILQRTAVITVFIVACECFQLTGIPVEVSRSSSEALRWFGYAFLGTHFGWGDMAAYAVGIVGIVAVDAALVKKFLPSHPEIRRVITGSK